MAAVLRLHAVLSTAETGLRQADADQWPAPYDRDFGRDELLGARNLGELAAGLTIALNDSERLLLEQERSMSAEAAAEGRAERGSGR